MRNLTTMSVELTGFGLGDIGAVVNLGDAFFASSLSEVEASRRSVGHDVATNRLLGIRDKGKPSTWVRLNLVGQIDSNVEFLGNLDKTTQHLVQLLLSLRQLASTRKVSSEEGNDAVDHLWRLKETEANRTSNQCREPIFFLP